MDWGRDLSLPFIYLILYIYRLSCLQKLYTNPKIQRVNDSSNCHHQNVKIQLLVLSESTFAISIRILSRISCPIFAPTYRDVMQLIGWGLLVYFAKEPGMALYIPELSFRYPTCTNLLVQKRGCQIECVNRNST
jgi:hypothetical protein